jgi:Leucine-rich repeat (LRR) protein
VQASPDIAKLYAQAAGAAQFLIDGESGSHREAFVDLLKAVYRGTDQLDTLPKAAGVPRGKLDEQYRAFLNVTDSDLAAIPSPDRLRNLSLGRTGVTDAGLANLAGAKNLEWLDLSGTTVTDKGAALIADMPRLTQLFLEGTKITDATLAIVGKLKSLEELDLSHLSGITDDGLAALAPLRQLKVLHLTGSPISDAGIVHLQGLKQLESLDVSGTKVTAEGLKRLTASLTKLNAQP